MDTEELRLHTLGASAAPDTEGLTALRVSLRLLRQPKNKKQKEPEKNYNFKPCSRTLIQC